MAETVMHGSGGLACRCVAITGTPGTGKTTISRELHGILRRAGKEVHILSLNEFVDVRELWVYREDDGTAVVDIDGLRDACGEYCRSVSGMVIMDGHLSHLVDVDAAVVLRCRPDVLENRLKMRGYPSGKLRDNLMAEAIGVISWEVRTSGLRFVELDTSAMNIPAVIHKVIEMLSGKDVISAPVDHLGWAEYIESRW